MRYSMSVKCLRLAVTLTVVLALVGCQEADQSDPQRAGSVNTISRPTPKQIGRLKEGIIEPGLGTLGCYIGMQKRYLGDGWEKVDEISSDEEQSYVNRSLGILAGVGNGMVVDVEFLFKSRRYPVCDYKTSKGVSGKSTLTDVRTQYGNPSFIITRIMSPFSKYPGAQELSADYVEMGVKFSFIDDELASIFVLAPQLDFDYEGYARARRAMGKPLSYIRPREERNKPPRQTNGGSE